MNKSSGMPVWTALHTFWFLSSLRTLCEPDFFLISVRGISDWVCSSCRICRNLSNSASNEKSVRENAPTASLVDCCCSWECSSYFGPTPHSCSKSYNFRVSSKNRWTAMLPVRQSTTIFITDKSWNERTNGWMDSDKYYYYQINFKKIDSKATSSSRTEIKWKCRTAHSCRLPWVSWKLFR